MKKFVKVIIVLVIVAIAGGFFYWQYNKKRIIKDSIKDAIAKKSDSLYYIQYDSSNIDEINGNAAFYNVTLQSDDDQKKLLSSTDSLPNAIFNIRIKKVAASGIDMAGLVQQQNVAAGKILLSKPVIQIINTGANKNSGYTVNDTLALYRKILGKFKSIKADTIEIENGTLLITNKEGVPQTTLENISISLNKFLIDSTRDYQNIISYFIKDVKVQVNNIQLPVSKNNTRINIEKFDYDAVARTLHVGAIKQYEVNNINPISDLRNIHITNLSTDAFIIQQRLKAGIVTCDGGEITIFKKDKSKTKDSTSKSVDLSSDLIDQAQVEGIKLGNTNIHIVNRDNPKSAPLVLKNTRFEVLTPIKVNGNTTVNNLINDAEWLLSADGFESDTKDGLYKMVVGAFTVNNKTSTATIRSFAMKPLVSEQQFVQRVKFQKDQYNLDFKNITVTGINISKLLKNEGLEIQNISMQPQIRIYNDKTAPPEGGSMLGKYPHQQFKKLDFPVYVKQIKVINGLVSYRERATKSEMVGNVFFNNLNATLTNVTNIPSRLSSNDVLMLSATAKFLGTGDLSTQWKFPMNNSSGAFNIKGTLKNMNTTTLNSIIEPLAMASSKAGHVDKVTFDIDGSNTKAVADILFLYKDLKMEILKKDGDDLKKKGLLSLITSAFVKKENTDPANSKHIIYERDISRSFFNLVWKTIFTGVKTTAMGKKGD